MPDLGRVHRFRDYAVAGVNWRPTRFVDDVPSSGICGLCRMIPKRIVLLPCLHTLCQSCHVSSFQCSGGRCPLDRQPFEESECVSYDTPTRKMDILKVHCWNEAHGCEFEGTMEDMLRHYENECSFHTVECMRCGQQVQHRDLSAHYVAGCSACVSAGRTENTHSYSAPVSLQELTAALEKQQTLLKDLNYDQLLPAIQSQINELSEQVRTEVSRLAEIASRMGKFEENLKAGIDDFAASVCSTISEQLRCRPNATDEAIKLSLKESRHMLQKLEHFASLSIYTLEEIRRPCSQHDHHRVIARCEHANFKGSTFPRALSMRRTWGAGYGSDDYILTLENCENISLNGSLTKHAQITVLHRRDAYFTIEVSQNFHFIFLYIEFYVMSVGSHSSEASVDVLMYDWNEGYIGPLDTCQPPCDSRRDIGESCIYLPHLFKAPLAALKSSRFLRDGTVKFTIHVSQHEDAKAGPSSA